jgi:hypothetical protein
MTRRVLFLLGLPVIAAAALSWPASAQKAQTEAPPANKTEPSVADRLAQRIDFSGIDDPNTSLSDALQLLTKQSGLAFDVDEAAFRKENVADVLASSIGGAVPKMKNVSVERVLRKLLNRAPGESGATFLVRREAVEVTTRAARDAEVWPRDPNSADGEGVSRQPHLPLVSATFNQKPLGEALKELARQSGMSVLVDVRVAEKAKTPVTARFQNAPVDTAVGVLADMADLKPFSLDNALYVTTRENADRLEERTRPKTGLDEADMGPYRIGNGPGRRPPSPAGM